MPRHWFAASSRQYGRRPEARGGDIAAVRVYDRSQFAFAGVSTMLRKLSEDSAHLLVPHVIQGKTLIEAQVEHRSRATSDAVMTPAIDLDSLIWPRSEPGPAFDTPIGEIVDFLEAVGKALDFDRNRYLREAAAHNLRCNNLGARILENCYRDIASFFEREAVEAEAAGALGSLAAVDGWQDRTVRGARGLNPRLSAAPHPHFGRQRPHRASDHDRARRHLQGCAPP